MHPSVKKWLPKQFKRNLPMVWLVWVRIIQNPLKNRMVAMLECQSFVYFSSALEDRTGPHPRLLCYLKRSTLGSLVTTQGEILGVSGTPNAMGWVASRHPQFWFVVWILVLTCPYNLLPWHGCLRQLEILMGKMMIRPEIYLVLFGAFQKHYSSKPGCNKATTLR